VAIGSPDKAARLGQLKTYARCQVWSGYRADDEIRADIYEAALAEVHDEESATALTSEIIAAAREDLARASDEWPERTSYDRLQEAFADLREQDVVVLEAVNDHWDAAEVLTRLGTESRRPRGIAYFTHPDVWHAVEHGMLELNVWHGDSANVAPGDALLDLVLGILKAHGIESVFDEGRIEASVEWQRRADDRRLPDER
jgi:uncharacterized protein DUF6891